MGALDLHLESASAQHGQAKLNVEEYTKGSLESGGNYKKEKINGSDPDDFEKIEKGIMQYGCPHYRRRCRIRAPCCNEIFDCRHCHNEVKNSIKVDTMRRHELPRQEVQQVSLPSRFTFCLQVTFAFS
jgi:RING finger/CHY zinc finger protein 1